MSKRDILVVDLDNTIADDEWRQKYIYAETLSSEGIGYRFTEYHSLMGFDKPKNLHIFGDYPLQRDVYFMTSRPNIYRRITSIWLCEHGLVAPSRLENHCLYGIRLQMRSGPNDPRSPADLKKAMLAKLGHTQRGGAVKLGWDNITAYDDDPDIRAMFTATGQVQKVLDANDTIY